MNDYMICADCSASDPSWASINKGVLLCDECCSVHRILGKHISHIRSLNSTNWPPKLKETVYSLVEKGANTLWEYQLHNTSHSKVKIRKPTPRDKLHPTKHDFIVVKYKHLSFLPHISNKENFNPISNMSKQLHASVRTNNLETCLRLLSLGADPNYMHPDRGNTPLHVAAQAGQAMQVELLVVNGADPSTLDRLGHTSEECARIAGHHQLADRLIECQYELTDKLSAFVSGRKPVHSIGEHFLVPHVGSCTSPNMLDAHKRLQEISNDQLEELAADVYDEVDRRETDSLWLTTQQLQRSIAFLPVNPTLSPLRNQARQKLATLNAQEFAQLVIDILLDTKRRQALSLQTGKHSGSMVPMTGEDKSLLYDSHDYDEVAMDSSSPSSPASNSLSPSTRALPLLPSERPLPEIEPEPGNSDEMHSKDNDNSETTHKIPDYAELKDPPPRQSLLQMGMSSEGVKSASVARVQFDLVKDKLKKVQAEKEHLESTNRQLQTKLDELQLQFNKVVEENVRLQSTQRRSPTATTPTSPLPVIMEPVMVDERKEKGDAPTELYAQVKKTSSRSQGDHQASLPSSPRQTIPMEDLYTIPYKKTNSIDVPPTVTPPPPRQDTPLSDSPFEDSSEVSTACHPPSVESVHNHIKGITQCIQELFQLAQSNQQANFVPCSQKLASAVDTLIRIFPQGSSQEVTASLREVTQSSHKLQEACCGSSGHSDLAYRTRLIINSAYDVAKACRHLVMCVEQAGSNN